MQEIAVSHPSNPAAPGLRPYAHGLPVPLTSLIGRDVNLIEIVDLFHNPDCRLVTLCGLGGIGKSRMALHMARSFAGAAGVSIFPDGVFLVPLAPIAPRGPLSELLATSISSAMGMTVAGPELVSIQLAGFLRERALLIVLDGLDQFLAGASLLTTLLQSAPGLKILVTSRERLNLRGEQVITLAGLDYPPRGQAAHSESTAQYTALQLFEQTARSVSPDFCLGPTNSAAVAEICRLVDGLPLAIELAARWTPILSCAEIAAEIAQNLDFLTDETRDPEDHQQSLRAVFTQSWALLTPAEQQAMARLSIFRGSFTRAAATEVADASLPLLAALVNKSLVRRIGGESGSAARYELPEPLRQYAAEQLERTGTQAETASHHARFYLDLLIEQTRALRGPGQQDALATLHAEIDQLRSAWHHATRTIDAAGIGQAAQALFHFYDMRSWFQEGASVFAAASEALAPQRDDPAIAAAYGAVLARHGWFTFHLGQQHEARAILESSLSVLNAHGHQAEVVFCLNYLAAVCAYLGDYDAAERIGHQGLDLARGLRDAYGQAVANNILGQAAYERGDYPAARRYSEQSLAIEQQIGNRWSMAYSLTNLGKVAYVQGDYIAAHKLHSQSLDTRAAIGDLRGVAICYNRLGDTATAIGDYTRANEYYAQSIEIFRNIGNRWGQTAVRISQGRQLISRNQPGEAVPLLHEALRLAIETGSAPQIAAIAGLVAPLIRPHDQAWADELTRLSPTADPEQLHEPAVRLLAWHYREPPESSVRAIGAGAGRGGHPGGLTSREVEVLRLVAKGLTDAQVAEQLVLSPRTVSTHLTSIYGKLGISSRSAATRFAVEQGLA